MGADVVKVNYTGDAESFAHVVECACVPVVIAGGAKLDSPRDFLDMVRVSIDAGGAGLSVGRNVFQHSDPTRLVEFSIVLFMRIWTWMPPLRGTKTFCNKRLRFI